MYYKLYVINEKMVLYYLNHCSNNWNPIFVSRFTNSIKKVMLLQIINVGIVINMKL